MDRLIIRGGKAVLKDRIEEGLALVCEDGFVSALLPEDKVVPSPSDTVLDADGLYFSPGFIDMHTHGAGGADFMDGTVDAYVTAARMHASHGTTLLFPTTLTSTNELLYKTFDIYGKASRANVDGAAFGGMHLEGPYFAKEYA